jgi:hypothetical protein
VVAASLVVLASVSAARPAFADWLVTRDGQLIETVGTWRIEGGQVVFESRSIPVSGWISRSGTRFTVSVDQIDLTRSVAETEAGSGVRREDLSRSVLDAPAAPRTLLEGWERWEYLGRPPDRAELVLKMGGGAWDNFLQGPDSRPRQEVAAGIAEGRLTWRVFGGVKSYLEAGHIRYDAVPSTTAYGVGLRVDGPRHGFQVGGRLEPDRRAPELNDAGDVSDIRWYRARYFGHSRAFNWSLSGERLEQRFEEFAARESTAHGLRAAILYRAFDGRLAPELGFGWSVHDASGETEDERQRTLQFAIRATPVRPLALAIRFERTQRHFVVTETRARNFGREDTRRRWVLEGEIKLSRQLAFSLLYTLVEGDSTRAGRDFTARNAAAGLTVTLGSTRRPVAESPRRRPAAKPRPAGRNLASSAAEPAAPQRPQLAAHPGASNAQPTSASVPTGAPPEDRELPDPDPIATPSPRERLVEAPQPVRIASRLLDLHTRSAGGETTTTLRGDGELRYSTLTLAAPHRFVLDLLGVVVGSSRTIALATDPVRRVRVAQFRPGPQPVARVVFDLELSALVKVESREGSLQIRVRRAGGASSTSSILGNSARARRP